MYNKAPQATIPVCPACQEDEQTDFDLVRDTLNDHPEMNSEQISEISGVAVDCILRMVDTGSLSSINFEHSIKCGRCGAPAIGASKKLCQSCLDKLDKEVSKSRNSIELRKKKDAQVGEYSANMRAMLDAKRR